MLMHVRGHGPRRLLITDYQTGRLCSIGRHTKLFGIQCTLHQLTTDIALLMQQMQQILEMLALLLANKLEAFLRHSVSVPVHWCCVELLAALSGCNDVTQPSSSPYAVNFGCDKLTVWQQSNHKIIRFDISSALH